MSASATDYLTKVGNPGTATTLSAPGHTIAGTTFNVASTSNWPTTTGVIFAIDQYNTATAARVPGSYTEWEGVVASSTQITGGVLLYGTDQNYAAGSTTRVYIPVASSRENRLIDGLLASGLTQAGGMGAISPTSVTSGSITNTGALNQTGATTLNGSWDGWIGANESWTYASASTITVPTDATTKYDVGDYIKITQSATVKYFVIIATAATLLTVSGLNGVTVANSAITLNAYSKARSPHGTAAVSGTLPYNPYKFRLTLTAAQNSINGNTRVLFDTKSYDTGSNVDIVTNKGRFTAPIAGYYNFKGVIAAGAAASGFWQAYLYKNGSLISFGSVFSITGINPTSNIVDDLQLAATDYVELFIGSSGVTALSLATGGCIFSGSLISAL